jgi:hypothetical protein
VVVEMEVEVETVVEETGRCWCCSSLRRWCAGNKACIAAEKGISGDVVASIERRRPFIGVGHAKRGGKKARKRPEAA